MGYLPAISAKTRALSESRKPDAAARQSALDLAVVSWSNIGRGSSAALLDI